MQKKKKEQKENPRKRAGKPLLPTSSLEKKNEHEQRDSEKTHHYSHG